LAAALGRSWRVDETYLKVRGEWTYLHRAVDKAGQTVDFRLSRTRDVAAAKAFFKKAIRYDGRPPHTITLDGYVASHRAVREMREDALLPWRTKLRSSKYLNNLIEQDPWYQIQNQTDAWLQELRICRHHNRWHRTSMQQVPRSRSQAQLGH
jgi:transposase-like protein